jgi:hypothetical protein
MIGDYMTKPLQGNLFTRFRDQIMGVTPAKEPKVEEPRSHDLAKKKEPKEGLVQHVEKDSKLHHRSVLGKVKSGNGKKVTSQATKDGRLGRKVKNG